MNRILRLFCRLAFLASLASLPIQLASAQTYSMTQLSTLGGTSSTATAINNSGQIVGTSALPGDADSHAFLFHQGKIRDLGTLGGRYSYASDINDRGEVAGESSVSGFPGGHGFVYSRGVLRDIGVLDDDCLTVAAINNSGDLTGASGCRRFAAFGYHAGQIYSIGGLGGPDSGGRGINDRGQIVGNASVVSPSFPPHAFLYTAGSLQDLGTLGGSSSFVESAHSINRHGEVTGSSDILGDNEAHVFFYSNGSMQDIGTLGGSFASGIEINDRGQVTGYSNTSNNAATHAFLYSRGRMVDLGTLGGTISYSQAINNQGTVIGYSLNKGNKELHAFVYRDHRIADLNNLVDNRSPWKKLVTLSQGIAINDRGDIVVQGVNNATGVVSSYLLEECRSRGVRAGDSGTENSQETQNRDQDELNRPRCSCSH